MIGNYSLLDYEECVNSSSTDINDTIYYYFNLTEDISEAVIHAYASVLGLIIVIGVVCNSLVLLLVLLDKRLRYRSIIASLSVVVCDLLLSIFYHGVALTGGFMKRWPYQGYPSSQTTCDSYAIATLSLLMIRWSAISVIAIDRFCTVRFPFKYPRYSKKVLILLTVLTWVMPPSLALLNLPVSSFTFRPNIPTCLPSCLNEESISSRILCRILSTGAAILILLVGIIVPSLVYTWLYYKGRQLRRQPKLGTFTEQPSTNMTTSKSFELFTLRDQRAMVTLGFLLYLTVLITGLPQIMIGFTRYSDNCTFFRIPLGVHLFFSLVFFSSTSLDPIILLRHQDFRLAIKEILCRRRQNPPVQLVRLIRTIRQPQDLTSPVTDTTLTLSQNINQLHTTWPQDTALHTSQSLDECPNASPAEIDEVCCSRLNGSIIFHFESKYKLSKVTEV